MELVNKIEVVPMKSEYCKVEHHTIVIDGTPLDILLNNYYPSNNILGLIPTIIDWVYDPKEKECIQGRFNSASKEVILPVLICPDDCDLWCTVIVANVVKADGYIIWKQVGIDMSTRGNMLLGCEGIGSEVDWLDKVPPMTFEEAQYRSHLSKIYD